MLHKVEWCNRNLIINNYHFCLVLNEKTFNKELDRLKVEPHDRSEWVGQGADASTHFYRTGHGKRVAIVALKETEDMTATGIVGLLIHEAVHIWQYFCNSIGEKEPSIEFEAYAIQAISQELIESYSIIKHELNKKKKKA